MGTQDVESTGIASPRLTAWSLDHVHLRGISMQSPTSRPGWLEHFHHRPGMGEVKVEWKWRWARL